MARKRTTDKQHRWLSQVEVTGVVFSEPVLAEAAPSGFPNLDKKVLARFHKAREIWNLPKGMLKDDGQAAWVRFVLEEILRLRSPKDWLVGSAIPAELVVRLPAQQETLRPDRVLVDDGAPVLLLLEVPRTQSLDRPWVQPTGRWKASPTTKLERLLRETKVELGLVTSGEAWRLVVASPSETASWLTWTASSWAESPVTLAAFRDLLGEERFFAGAREDVALELIRRSRERQLDVADQLGEQARQALAMLIHELDRVDAECGGAYLDTYTEREVFEAIVAFIMRLLFLLFAEENALLPHGSVAYDRSYGVLHLLTELEGQHRLSPDKLKHSYSAFARLLATSRLIHDGSVDPDIRIAAHGGRLFDPDRYPLLEGRRRDGGWAWEPAAPPRVSDAVVREVLRSLKYAQADGSRQLVSYRTLAVEQIGHMYEGLLDLRILRAPSDQALILLESSPKQVEPQVRWHEVQGLAEADCVTLLAQRMSRTNAQVTKALERARKYPSRGGTSSADLPADHPAVLLAKSRGVIRPRGRYLGLGEDRHSQGTHYTPLAVTQPMVRRLLRPLTRTLSADDGTTSLRTAQEILALRVCDPAAGSGAFLVQATRFLAEELVEAWEAAEAAAPDSKLSLPFGTPAGGKPEELLMPADRAEKELWAKRYVVEHCIYGVDINPLAVEMAKLSLWLVALSKDKPFTFLDHALRSGNSVIGVTSRQLQTWSVSPSASQQGLFAGRARTILQRSANLRRRVWEFAPAADEAEKGEILRQSIRSTRQARIAADLLVSAWLGGAGQAHAERTAAQDQLRLAEANSEEDWNALAATAERRLKGEVPFHWPIEFPEVFAAGAGFNAIAGNPPWASYSGRGAHPLSESLANFYENAYRVFRGWKALHPLFVERSMTLLGTDGRVGLVLPAQVADLDGYGATRVLVRKMLKVPSDLPYFGEDAFKGVTQPSFGLIGTRYGAQPVQRQTDSSPLQLALKPDEPDANGGQEAMDWAIRLMNRLTALPKPPSAAFKDPGVHSGNCAKLIVLKAPEGSCAPVREGKNLFPFDLRPATRWLRLDFIPEGKQYFTIRRLEHYTSVPILLRQTAKHPIAALHRDPTYFRNSMLGCIGLPGTPHEATVAWLNSSIVAWYHISRLREAKQKAFPQVKVKHLRDLPLPPWTPEQKGQITSAVRALGQAPEPGAVDQLDQLVSRVYGLSAAEHLAIRTDILRLLA